MPEVHSNEGSNKLLEQWLTNSMLHIETRAGITELGKYLSDLNLIQTGVPYSELGISKRRQESKSIVVPMDFSFGSDIADEQVKDGIGIIKVQGFMSVRDGLRSEEHTSELQSQSNLVC